MAFVERRTARRPVLWQVAGMCLPGSCSSRAGAPLLAARLAHGPFGRADGANERADGSGRSPVAPGAVSQTSARTARPQATRLDGRPRRREESAVGRRPTRTRAPGLPVRHSLTDRKITRGQQTRLTDTWPGCGADPRSGPSPDYWSGLCGGAESDPVVEYLKLAHEVVSAAAHVDAL
jgi:hypothetical protein